MAFYNEYDIIQLKSKDGSDAMPRTTPRSIYFSDGETLADKWSGQGGSTVTMADNPAGGVDLTVDTSTRTLVDDVQLNAVRTQLENGYTSESNGYPGHYRNKTIGSDGEIIAGADYQYTTPLIPIESDYIINFRVPQSYINVNGILWYSHDKKLLRFTKTETAGTWVAASADERYIAVVINMIPSQDYVLINYQTPNTEPAPLFIVDFGSYQEGIRDKQSKLIAGTNITIGTDGKTISATSETYDDTEIREDISSLSSKVDELELFKFPNVTIIGEPTITHGQISDFSSTSYLKFPFLVDFKNQPFEISMSFTTSGNVTNQENIFDSDFGLAYAIRNGKFVIAISTNGTSWDLGEGVGTYTVQPNTTYYVKIAWDKSNYTLAYSLDGTAYTTDITVAGTVQPYPKQIYIGVGENFASILNHFSGIVNLNNATLKINGEVVWSGMDDAGLSTRADVSLSNLDADGIAKIKEVASDITPMVDEATLTTMLEEVYNG